MGKIEVYYDAKGSILIELGGAALELTRPEAEQMFVDIGHVLQDMDIQRYDENGETTPQPGGEP